MLWSPPCSSLGLKKPVPDSPVIHPNSCKPGSAGATLRRGHRLQVVPNRFGSDDRGPGWGPVRNRFVSVRRQVRCRASVPLRISPPPPKAKTSHGASPSHWDVLFGVPGGLGPSRSGRSGPDGVEKVRDDTSFAMESSGGLGTSETSDRT